MPRGCTCPKDGSSLCERCAALVGRAGLALPLAVQQPSKKGQALLCTSAYDSTLEEEYAAFLELLKRAHDIWDYWYKPWKFLLAKQTTYEPDFLVQRPNGFLEVHEVKGYWREDAKLKWKITMDRYPFFTYVVIQKINGEWKEERL